MGGGCNAKVFYLGRDSWHAICIDRVPHFVLKEMIYIFSRDVWWSMEACIQSVLSVFNVSSVCIVFLQLHSMLSSI